MPIFRFRDRYYPERLIPFVGTPTGDESILEVLDLVHKDFINNIEFAGHDMTGVPVVDSPDETILREPDCDGLLWDRWRSGDGRHSRGGWMI